MQVHHGGASCDQFSSSPYRLVCGNGAGAQMSKKIHAAFMMSGRCVFVCLLSMFFSTVYMLAHLFFFVFFSDWFLSIWAPANLQMIFSTGPQTDSYLKPRQKPEKAQHLQQSKTDNVRRSLSGLLEPRYIFCFFKSSILFLPFDDVYYFFATWVQ